MPANLRQMQADRDAMQALAVTDSLTPGTIVQWVARRGDADVIATGTIVPTAHPAPPLWRSVEPDAAPGTAVAVHVDALHPVTPLHPAQPTDGIEWFDAYVTDALDPDDAGEWIDVRPITRSGGDRDACLTAFTDGDVPVIAVYLIDRESRPGLPDGITWLADFARRADAERFAATFHMPVTVTSTDRGECQPATYPRITR